jgi:peptidyl-tRNA hydrolase, PTH1 family
VHRIIVGLGNPGSQYATTRHNAGFWVIDALISALGAPKGIEQTGPCIVSKVLLDGVAVHLVQPQGYMNKSGEALKQYLAYYKLTEAQVLVAADEVYRAPGTYALRTSRGHGGHNGLKSLGDALTAPYATCMIGVGIFPQDPQERAQAPALDEYVLQRMSLDDQVLVHKAIDRVVPDLVTWARTGSIVPTTDTAAA